MKDSYDQLNHILNIISSKIDNWAVINEDYKAVDEKICEELLRSDIDWNKIINPIEKEVFYREFISLWSEPLKHSMILEELLCATVTSIDKVSADKENLLKFTCLRLLAHAIRLFESINVLTRVGYFEGAAILCRTIEEDMVISLFIIKHGNEVANLYYENANKGFDIKGDYAWADGYVQKKQPKDRVGLNHLRKDCLEDYEEMNKQYAELCKFVHPAAQSIFRDVDLQLHEIQLGPSIRMMSYPSKLAITYIHKMLLKYTELDFGNTFTSRVRICSAWMDQTIQLYNLVDSLIAKK